MLSEKIEEVRIVRGGNNLDRLASLVGAVGIGKAVKSIAHITQQARMQTAIRLFKADDGRRIRQISESEQRQRNESALGKIVGLDDVISFAGAKRNRTLPRTWGFKQDSIKFWNPNCQLFV